MSILTEQRAPSSVLRHADVLARSAAGPAVLAHRGSPGAGRPENTVAAAVAALHAGADGVEIDVRASADGQLVCVHDPDVVGGGGVRLPVATTTAADLRRVRLPGGHPAPLLDELLSAAACYGRRRVVVEAKPCADVRSARRVAATLAGVLSEFGGALEITVSSFDPVLLAAVRSALGELDVATALLGTASDAAAELLRHAVRAGHGQIHPNLFSLLRTPLVADAARGAGIAVTCWTVNRPRHVARLAAIGVDALITDDVGGVRAALRHRATSGTRATPCAAR